MTAEQEPQVRPRFASLRTELLYRFVLDGWGNQSSGDLSAPTGRFARISITEAEAPEVFEAFEEVLDAAGPIDRTLLQGHFLVTETADNVVDVHSYMSEQSVIAVYNAMEAEYRRWQIGGSR